MSQLIRDHEPLVSPKPKRPKKLVEVELEVYGETVRASKSDPPDGRGIEA